MSIALHGAWSGLSERSRDSWWRSEKGGGRNGEGFTFGEPNAFLHLHLAEAYKKVGRNNDARRELKKILDMTPEQSYLPEYKAASADAQKLLDQIDMPVDRQSGSMSTNVDPFS